MRGSSNISKSNNQVAGNVILNWYFWLVAVIDIKSSLEVYGSLRMATSYTELCVSQATNAFCFCASSLFREKWGRQDVGDLKRGRKGIVAIWEYQTTRKNKLFLAQSWVLHTSVQGSPSEAGRETYASWLKLAPNWRYLSENALEEENLSDFS